MTRNDTGQRLSFIAKLFHMQAVKLVAAANNAWNDGEKDAYDWLMAQSKMALMCRQRADYLNDKAHGWVANAQ